jgi:hypothetical protein
MGRLRTKDLCPDHARTKDAVWEQHLRSPVMSALVVVESYFGNTRHIADVVALRLRSEGIDTEVVDVADAPAELDHGIELLVVGAPTHDLGLSTAESRQAASARKGNVEPLGVREWIELVTTPNVPPLVALYDTRTGYPWLPGSAAAAASALLSGKGFPVIPARETFRVQGIAGPLNVGEDQRAERWTSVIAAHLQQQRRTRRA